MMQGVQLKISIWKISFQRNISSYSKPVTDIFTQCVKLNGFWVFAVVFYSWETLVSHFNKASESKIELKSPWAINTEIELNH